MSSESVASRCWTCPGSPRGPRAAWALAMSPTFGNTSSTTPANGAMTCALRNCSARRRVVLRRLPCGSSPRGTASRCRSSVPTIWPAAAYTSLAKRAFVSRLCDVAAAAHRCRCPRSAVPCCTGCPASPDAAHLASGAAVQQGVLIGLHAAVRLGVVREWPGPKLDGGHRGQGALAAPDRSSPSQASSSAMAAFNSSRAVFRLSRCARCFTTSASVTGSSAGGEQCSGGQDVQDVPHGWCGGSDTGRGPYVVRCVR